MIDSKIIEQVKQLPMKERVEFVETIIQSLKDDLKKEKENKKSKEKPA